MKVREFYQKLEQMILPTLSCEWDNDGLMCCPDGNKEVKKVLVALDVTSDIVQKAIDGGYDVIVSHHPFIFKGLKAIDDEGAVSAKAIKLIAAGIAVMSFHTRLDALEGGVNDILCDLLGLSDVEALTEDGIPIGRIGTLDAAISAEELAQRVKQALGVPFVLLSDVGIPALRVAVLGGSGKDFIELARASGADSFVSGRLDYHPMTDARDNATPMNLIEAGHFYTEAPVCEKLVKIINEIDGDIRCDVYSSNIIRTI